MGESPERRTGCGVLSSVFGRRNKSSKKITSSVSHVKNTVNNVISTSPEPTRIPTDKIIARPGANHPKIQAEKNLQNQPIYNQNRGKRTTYENKNQGKKVLQGTLGISGELDSMINDHQRSKKASDLVRASSGNVMLFGHLGNLRQPGGGGENNLNVKITKNGINGRYPNSGMGNIVKKQSEVTDKPTSLCRALSTRMDPEELKILGNEDYKNGNFVEALALYEVAISIDPNKASYRSNKSAALNALGRVLEAVFEYREAIRIEPFYQRAHNRLATLYLRLGDAEKAIYHYKHAGAESDPDVMTKAKSLQIHLTKCTEAKKLRDWNALLRETMHAISSGADSAPQIFGLQAEALLRMNRHQEADEALKKGPNFEIDDCTKFLGPIGNSSLLVIRAQVDMSAGRFDDAVAVVERAARLDPNNKEASTMVRRTKAVAVARSKGNNLFRENKYNEACVAYDEGLEHDPYNSILLCNRATCRAKIGHFERAIEDCTKALKVRPSYGKARLRRADCYAQLKKWEASLQDYEEMKRETPEDKDVIQGLKNALLHLEKQQDQDRET